MSARVVDGGFEPTTTEPTTTEAPTDLRVVDPVRALRRACAALGVGVRSELMVRKRRTVSGPTARGTWLRIEARFDESVAARGWSGIEAAAVLGGVRKPAWYGSVSWRDECYQVWWRADEMQLVTEPAITAGGLLRADPGLSGLWWDTLRGSLAALSVAGTDRRAKFGDGVADQARVSDLVARTVTALGLPALAPSLVVVNEWAVAHADLSWANLTAPRCWVLDWEDWGRAPRGFDAATLLVESLAVPAVAERVRMEFADDLASQAGRLSLLMIASATLSRPRPEPELLEPLGKEAAHAVASLLG